MLCTHVCVYVCFVYIDVRLYSLEASCMLPASLVAQLVKNPLTIQETLGWEDPLEKEMATHSSICAWEIPWTEEPGGLQSMWSQKSDTT